MIGICIGVICFLIGMVMTLLLNRNMEVPMNGGFWDMPARIKIGILFAVFGVLLVCVSIMFELISDPVGFLTAF